MAPATNYPRLTAEEFLDIDFSQKKAELDGGVIRIIETATARHAAVQGNMLVALDTRLKGSGCRPYGAKMALRTNPFSIRYPDVSVYCGRDGPSNDALKAFDDPRVVFEVLSAGTARTDLRVKLDEYKALPSLDTIVFVDIASERLRVVQRTAPNAWSDTEHDRPIALDLPSLGIALPHEELFARG